MNVKKILIPVGLETLFIVYILSDFFMSHSSTGAEGRGASSVIFILFLVLLLLIHIGNQIWLNIQPLTMIISSLFLVVSILVSLLQAKLFFSIPLNIHLPILGAGFFIMGVSYLLKESKKIWIHKHLRITIGIESIYLLYMTYRNLFFPASVVFGGESESFFGYQFFEKIIVIFPLLVMIHMISLYWYKKSSELLFCALFLPVSILTSPVMHLEFFLFFSAFVFFSVGLLCFMYPRFKSTKLG
jgi:hypothetical protein